MDDESAGRRADDADDGTTAEGMAPEDWMPLVAELLTTQVVVRLGLPGGGALYVDKLDLRGIETDVDARVAAVLLPDSVRRITVEELTLHRLVADEDAS